MAINLKYNYVQGDTEVDILNKNKENIKHIAEKAGVNFVDDTTWKDTKQNTIMGKPLQVLQGEPFTPDDKNKINELEQTYAKKDNDFTSIDSTISVVGADGAKQGVITPPAAMAGVPVGLTAKLKIINPADPAHLPEDGFQMTLNGSYLWIDKTNNDVMQWNEIKDHIKNGEIMVLERIADSGGFKNYQLVKWEVVPKPSVSYGWVEIDHPTTHDWAKELGAKVRITGSTVSFTGLVEKTEENIIHITSGLFPFSFFDGSQHAKLYYWTANGDDVNNHIERLDFTGSSISKDNRFSTWNKVEIWKEL